MKKTVLLGTLLIFTGCTAHKTVEEQPYIPETINISMPCSYSCLQENCSTAALAPVVLKPRVTETYNPNRKKRRCCADDTPDNPAELQIRIPELPEIYVISANRTVNSMLNDAKAVFQDKTIKIFVEDTVIADKDLPAGAPQGIKTIKKRLSNVNTVLLTDKKEQADYLVKPQTDWFDTPTKQVPAIKYTLTLNSKDGIKIGEWTEVVHQAEGDRSWW